MISDRQQARLALGRDALLSEADAVALIPCRDCVAREWLREHNLVIVNALGRMVLWGDVLDEVKAGRGPVDPQPKPLPAGRLPRDPIKRR